MNDLKNLDKLAAPAAKAVELYCGKFLSLHAGNVRSLCVYGSAASGEFVNRHSNVNLLAVMAEIGISDLNKTASIAKVAMKNGIVAPLMLTQKHIETSTDVFPMEFLEFKENNLLLFGEDVLSGLKIDKSNLRLQCEQQLKGGLVRLHQAYHESALNEKQVAALLEHSVTSLTPVFRAMLRLKNTVPPVNKRKVLEGLNKEFGADIAPLEAALEIKEGEKPGKPSEIFGAYIKTVEMLASEADKLQ